METINSLWSNGRTLKKGPEKCSENQRPLYYQPKQCTILAEITQNYHTFVIMYCLISSLWVHIMNDPWNWRRSCSRQKHVWEVCYKQNKSFKPTEWWYFWTAIYIIPWCVVNSQIDISICCVCCCGSGLKTKNSLYIYNIYTIKTFITDPFWLPQKNSPSQNSYLAF